MMSLAALPADFACDVVVIGAGGAGMATALFAAIGGLSVLLVESTGCVGGTTALSAGTVWVPNTLHAAGTGDSPDQAALFLDRAVGNHAPAALRDAFLAHGPAAIALLDAQSEVRLRPYRLHPDYLQELPGAVLRGRALEPLPFDGRRLGPAFALLRPPIPEFTVLGGMMVDRSDIAALLNLTGSVGALRHAIALLGRHALDRLSQPRGTRLVMGNALAGRLLASLLARKVPIVANTEVMELQPDRSVVLRQNGHTSRLTARRGVVLASGGFARHPARRAAWLRDVPQSQSPAAPGHTGAAQDLALALGATFAPEGLDHGYWAPVSLRRRADGSQAAFPHFVMDRGKPGTVCVTAAGRRFVNECVGYHDFVRAMFATDGAVPAFLIADAAALRRYGLGMVRPGGGNPRRFIADGTLAAAASIPELAGKLGIDAAALGETVARMNRFADDGVDSEFGRGTTAYHRVNGDASRPGNPNLGPIATPPFYAVRLWPGDIGAATGLAVDAHTRLLDAESNVIPGFYAAGNDMQSVMGGVYPAPGINLGPALVFAAITAEHMLKGPP
jgi:succinate dehydrogenase/fumarate reductase flavoprotein subunit